MSPKRRKCVQQIQMDERGRLILGRGPFAKKLILTEEQASELQPIFDEFYVWDKRLRRWMMPCLYTLIFAVPLLPNLVPDLHVLTVALAPAVVFAPVLVAMQLNYMKQPWYGALRDLHRHLHKNAPRV